MARERAERREAEARLREAEAAERDTRTVFAYNLPTKANERDVFEFFAPAGPVSDVRIIYDRNTSRSKGMAYVEMLDRTTVGAALGLSGSQLRGQMVMVKASEAEKNIAWQAEKASKAAVAAVTATAAGNGAAIEALGGAPAQLRVAGLHSGLDASDVRSVFSPFGPLAACALDPSTPGEADVVFVNARDAGHALSQLHGMELAGCALRLSLAPLTALPPPPFASTPAILAASLAAQAAAAGSLGGGHDLDDSAEGGVRMDARGRAALMACLAGGAAATLTPGANGAGAGGMPGALGILGSAGIDPVTGRPVPLAAPAAPPPGPAPPAVVAANVRSIQGVLGPPSPIPTECVLLKNMFSPAEETEPNWWLDIQEDVAAECAKHGAVKHCWVDKASDGFIYLKFGAVAHAAAALAAMQGRWFAGRQVVAEFQFTVRGRAGHSLVSFEEGRNWDHPFLPLKTRFLTRRVSAPGCVQFALQAGCGRGSRDRVRCGDALRQEGLLFFFLERRTTLRRVTRKTLLVAWTPRSEPGRASVASLSGEFEAGRRRVLVKTTRGAERPRALINKRTTAARRSRACVSQARLLSRSARRGFVSIRFVPPFVRAA